MEKKIHVKFLTYFFPDKIVITLLAPIEEDYPETTQFLQTSFRAVPYILESHAVTLYNYDFFDVSINLYIILPPKQFFEVKLMIDFTLLDRERLGISQR